MSQTATIRSLPQAFEIIKEMRAEGYEWGEDYRGAGSKVLAEIIEGRMDEVIDRHLEEMAKRGEADRQNGHYRRHLLTELSEIELGIPRTRRFKPLTVVRAYARRAKHIDRMITPAGPCFVLGLSTRKVAAALLPVLGTPVSPATVSRVARTPDAAVAAFHACPLCDGYRVLMLDGVVLA